MTEAEAWLALESAARAVSAEALAASAQLLGVPAAALPSTPPGASESGGAWPWAAVPWLTTRIAAPSPAARLAGAVVADLSSMWAGPLCAHLLGLAGAKVIKVESPSRPDGARSGDPRFYDWLHAGHHSAAIDFRTESGRAALAALLDVADVVIESSRPRALASLGLAPGMVRHRDGQVWLSITGYGSGDPGLVAFGDDAAVAGGLVGRGDDAPVFCADAIADPLTGVCGALAVASSIAAGGGHLIDLPMRATAATFAAAPVPDHGPHEVRRGDTGDTGDAGSADGTGAAGSADGTGWRVTCPHLGLEQAVSPPRRPVPSGSAAPIGADTASVLGWLTAR